MFDVSQITQVLAMPEQYKLLTKVPYTLEEAQAIFNRTAVGDEIDIVILDLETTGLDKADDEIIEIGLVNAKYSVSARMITSVTRVGNYYEQPRTPITEEITHHTGITNEMVEGHKFDFNEIMAWFDGDPFVIAHNAIFDRPFFEMRFNVPEIKNLRWGCSIEDADWLNNGYESQKLEYLLFKLGYFYEAHRALVDCLATLVLLDQAEGALRRLLRNASSKKYTIHAIKAPFEVKDELSANGYKFDSESPLGKHWKITVQEDMFDETIDHLRSLYHSNFDKVIVDTTTSRLRYKK